MKTLYKLKLCILAVMGLLALNSCSTEDPIASSVTNYAVITPNNEEKNPYVLAPGETYEEFGAVALEDGTELEVETSYTRGHFTGELFDPNSTENPMDYYSARYSAENQDGFSASQMRDIIVTETGDFETSIAGAYRSTVVRDGTASAQYTDMGYVLIWQTGENTFEISDALGGYYDIGRAYGTDYINPGGVIIANDIAANDFSTPGTQTNIAFGGNSTIDSFSIDAETKSIEMVVSWEGFTFDIHLEQIQP
jgi:hypothetical protein